MALATSPGSSETLTASDERADRFGMGGQLHEPRRRDFETVGDIDGVAQPERAFDFDEAERGGEVLTESQRARELDESWLRSRAVRRGRHAAHERGDETMRAVIRGELPQHAGDVGGDGPERALANELEAQAGNRTERCDVLLDIVAAMIDGDRQHALGSGRL